MKAPFKRQICLLYYVHLHTWQILFFPLRTEMKCLHSNHKIPLNLAVFIAFPPNLSPSFNDLLILEICSRPSKHTYFTNLLEHSSVRQFILQPLNQVRFQRVRGYIRLLGCIYLWHYVLFLHIY